MNTAFDLNTINIGDLLPHSEPMVLLNKVISFEHERLTAEVSIHSESRFFDAKINGVPSWVGIEYMAQAIGLLAGIKSKLSGEEIKLGFLLGTRKYHIEMPVFEAGKTYQISVTEIYKDDSGLANFDCNVSYGELLIVQAKLNVYETDDATKILES